MSRSIFGVSLDLPATAVKELRVTLGWSQEKLAYTLGCSRATVQNWESGAHRPSVLAVDRMYHLCPDEDLRLIFRGAFPREPQLLPSRPPDPYDQVRADLEAVIRSGQSQLIGQAEEVLNRLADKARRMTQKRRPGKH